MSAKEGPGSLPRMSEEDQAAKRKDVIDYALTSLPPEERGALEEAVREDRGLVERESDPLRYLRFDGGSVPAAGERLASYWTERKELFQERFLLPLVITGQGALDQKSVEVTSTGVMFFLPDDTKGRSVLYLDHEVDTNHNLSGMEVRLYRGRMRFYLLHRAVERGRPLVCLRYSRTSGMDRAKVLAFQRFVKLFPVTLESMVMVYHVPAAASRVFNDTVIPVMNQYLKDLPENVSIAHVLGSTSKELGEKLKKLHFMPKGIPEKAGGTWTWDNFETWLKARRDIESMGDSKPAALQASAASASSLAALPPVPGVPAITTAEDRIRMAEERRNRKRQKDLEYSRDRRVREKGEHGTIQEQVDALQKTNDALRAEESRLSGLLDLARAHVEIQLYGRPLGASQIPPSLEVQRYSASAMGGQPPNPNLAPPPDGNDSGGSKSVMSPDASARESSAGGLFPTGYETGMGVPIHAMANAQWDAAARGAVPSLDLFSRGTIQAERIHTAVPSYGVPMQLDESLLALLLQRQQHPPQALIHHPHHHPLAFQQAFPAFQQLDPLLRGGDFSRGLAFSQFGGAFPPGVAGPIRMYPAPPRAYHEAPAPGPAGGDALWLLAQQGAQYPTVTGFGSPTHQPLSPPPDLPGRSNLDVATHQGHEASFASAGAEISRSASQRQEAQQHHPPASSVYRQDPQQHTLYPPPFHPTLLSPNRILPGDLSLYHLQQQQQQQQPQQEQQVSFQVSSSSFGKAARDRDNPS